MEFSINPALNISALAESYGERQRIEIADFLPNEQAEALRHHLVTRQDWVLVLNAGDQVYELPRARIGELSPDQHEALHRKVIDAARTGFQFRFESIRSPDGGSDATLLDSFVAFMSSAPTRQFLAEVTGHSNIDFADGQATRYGPGDFLTEHDDGIAGKNRLIAYVFGLAPIWQIDWGGLLLFGHDGDHVAEAFVPGMNKLRLFSVPAPHSVSYVAPFAGEMRLSVTGWLRSAQSAA